MTPSHASYSGARRVCFGCGVTAPGLNPPGWAIEAQYGWPVGAPCRMVVGERAYCPDCQAERTGVVAA